MKHYILKNYHTNETIFGGFYNSLVDCLESAVLAEMDLTGINLRNINLSNANLDGAYMPRSMLSGANLTGANLSEANLSGSVFHQAALYNTCLCETDLTYCDFQSANFGATDIAGCDISFSTFSALSCFDLDFMATRRMVGCSYIPISGKISRMSNSPIIVRGLLTVPLIVLDQEIHIGHKSLPRQNFSSLITLLEHKISQASKNQNTLNLNGDTQT